MDFLCRCLRCSSRRRWHRADPLRSESPAMSTPTSTIMTGRCIPTATRISNPKVLRAIVARTTFPVRMIASTRTTVAAMGTIMTAVVAALRFTPGSEIRYRHRPRSHHRPMQIRCGGYRVRNGTSGRILVGDRRII